MIIIDKSRGTLINMDSTAYISKGYFEMEIERMTNMGGTTRESTRCRNYKIALEAIRGYFGV